MRIQALNLAAFGPFSERSLEFDGDALQIVYGPNEAGKSSALRALKALLFGIETNTRDNFVHSYSKLRIAGRLRAADGQELRFMRRKGRKNTLLSADGEVLSEQALMPFLQGVTAPLFETLFGLDHQALVQGGEEILQQQGEVGQALFSAALGSHALHRLLADLDAEADAIFRPRGSTQQINAALKNFTELNKQVRECSLPSAKWEEQQRALERTSQALAELQSELAGDRIALNRLRRIQRVLPKLARRRELLQELDSMGEVVTLSADFAERRQQAVNGLELAQGAVARAASYLNELQHGLNGLAVNRALLEQAEAIEDLHARLGSHRSALRERPQLEAERRQRSADAESRLREIRPELALQEIAALRPLLAAGQIIFDSGKEHAVLTTRLELATSNLQKTETLIKIIHRERAGLPQSGSPDILQKTVAAARKEGDLDGSIESLRCALAALQEDCAADLSRLELWHGGLEDLAGVQVPNRESINRLAAAYDGLGYRLQRLAEKRETAAEGLHEAALRLDQIQRAGRVPTEADLAVARSERDTVWQLLRRHWLGGEDVSAEAGRYLGEERLPDVYERRIADADELADRLRREADRVAESAALQAKQDAGQRALEGVAEQLAVAAAEQAGLDAEWRELWANAGIEPRSPREMLVWLDDFEKLRSRNSEMRALRQKAGQLEQARDRHIQQLNRQLLALGVEREASARLETELLECEALTQRLVEVGQKRLVLDKKIIEREAEVHAFSATLRLATEALAAWKTRWDGLMQRIGLPASTSPSAAGDYIEQVKALFAAQNEAEKLSISIAAIDDQAASLQNQVAGITAAVAPELTALSAEDAVVRLNSLLSENRSSETKRQQIEAQIEKVGQEIREAKLSIRSMSEKLDSLCAEAKCDSRGQLGAAQRRSDLYLGIRASVAALEEQILEAGEGASMAVLEAESSGIDPDTLPVRIRELSSRIDNELEPKRTVLAERKGWQEKELALMDGSDRAAMFADQAQAMLAVIRADAERYVRVKLAGRILRDQIEQYRKQNQGPLVRRAGQYFAMLTLGSFNDLTTDFNEQDEPLLAGIRASGEKVYVTGMSTGTRDQLYLALRLASLEKYMESSEPMPFIVDDVLVHFDDERSLAALKTLSVLAEKTQVILFTHHSQAVAQARQLPGRVRVHMLGAAL